MLRAVKELEHFKLLSSEGDFCGRVRDIYFDDHSWRVTHLVAALSPREHGRKQVLLSPASLAAVTDENQSISLRLSASEIAGAPSASSVLPVCKQYGSLAFSSPGVGAPVRCDPHLRSARAVMICELSLNGEPAGKVTDLLLDLAAAEVRYLAGEQWIDGRRVLFHLLPADVTRISWASQSVHLKALQPVLLEPAPALAASHAA